MSQKSSLPQPDKSDSIVLIPDNMYGPRVFETYKSDWETFQVGAPLAWHSYPETAPICTNRPWLPPGSLVLASLHKFGNIDLATGPPPDGIRHVLVAQNRKLVRYLTAYGEKAFNSIVDNGLDRPIDIEPSDQPPKKQPPNKTRMEHGTITLKSAWIEMTKDIDNPEAFYVRDAWVQDPLEQTCEPVKVGLVGLHIAHKTEASPQWLWTSFEHVKNVPPRGAVGEGGYTFNDGRSQMPTSPPPEARLTMRNFKIPPPYNVDRWKSIPEAIQKVNRDWRVKLSYGGSVWSNYELVVVQWPGIPHDEDRTGSGLQIGGQYSASPTPPCREETDASLANSVIETFVQPHTACTKRTTCMSCHNEARSYDFIWSIPIAHEQMAKTGGPPRARRSSVSILREIVEQEMRP